MPTQGTDGRGGGGGGAGGSVPGGLGARGGSGIVIVRYLANTTNTIDYADTTANDAFTNTSGTLAGKDVDTPSAALTYGISGGIPGSGDIATKAGTYGSLAVNTKSGAYTFAPNAASINALSASTTESYAVTVSDGTSTTTSNLVINLTGANDAPVNTVPGAQTVAEDTVLAFSGNTAISVADVDGNLASVGLMVTNGTLAVTLGTTGATISAGANNSATVTLAGTAAQINAALATLVYQGTLNFNGSDTLTVVATDALGATDTDTVAITVTTVNDAPTLAAGKVTFAQSAAFTVNTNGEVALTETSLVPPGAKVLGVTLNLEYSTYWSWDAVSGCYVRLNGTTFGPLGWTGVGTANNFVAVERKYAGPLPGYNAGSANTWTFGSAWNPTNLRNVTITVYYEATGEPALVLNGTEDTPVSFTAGIFENAFKDVEGAPLASLTVVTLPATGALKLSNVAVTPGQVIAAANLGNLTYEPASNDNGTKTFTVTASDGSLSSAAATVTINLAAVGSLPPGFAFITRCRPWRARVSAT